jgi:2-dehydro-3-deoxyphosphogluconate aldolase/(4S)-4-hydroxy-2-oxoglutarate aldolase
MQPMEFVDYFRKIGASAILRTSIEDAVAPAMEAAVRGGFRIVEFTLNTPDALDHITRFSRQEDLVVGAGTVLTVDEARSAIGAGAKFLVSPVVDEEVIEVARTAGVAVMPGTHTPTEMLRAHRAGAPLQKLFPAPGSGPDYVRACLGPLPFLRIVPTSGVDGSNVGQFLAAGSWAVGFVASLFVASDLEAGRFDRIERRAAELLGAVRAARA